MRNLLSSPQLSLRLSLLLLAVLVPSLAVSQDENPFTEKMPFAEATIIYAISGMENGSETIYVKDHGSRSASYHKTVSNMMGMTMENNTIEITDPDWVYSFNLVEGTGSKSRNPMKYLQEEFAKLTAAERQQVMKNSKLMGQNVMAGMGGKVEENVAEILGYSCDRVNAMGTTVYSIHGSSLAVKTESEMMGMKMSIIATAIDKGEVDDKYFAHPAGIEAVHDEEADAMSLQMAQQTMAWLKDPEASSKPMQMGVMDQPEQMPQLSPEDQEMMKQAQQMMQGMPGVPKE